MKTAVLYGRVSTNFVRQGLSIEAQDHRLRGYCLMKGLTIAEVFLEDESGTVPFLERPQGAAAWRDWLLPGRAAHLILTSLDRLGRKAADMLAFIDRCEREGITLHIVDSVGAVDLSDPNGKMFVQLICIFAENERLRIVQRINAGFERKRQRGEIINGTPAFGQRYVLPDGSPAVPSETVDAATGQVLRRRWPAGTTTAPCEEELTWLRWMIQCRAPKEPFTDLPGQGLGYGRIARALNERGVRTKTGKLWGDGNVLAVLSNPFARQQADLLIADHQIHKTT